MTMTVGELKQRLAGMPDDQPVAILDGNGWLNEISYYVSTVSSFGDGKTTPVTALVLGKTTIGTVDPNMAMEG